MKERTKAMYDLTEVVTTLAEIVRELDHPGRTNQYKRIADLLERARGAISRAEAYEH